MMVHNNSHLIARLKQQPRLGATPTPDPSLLQAYTDGLKTATSEANITMGAFGKLTSIMQEQGEAFIKLVNAQNFYQTANAGLQKSFGINAGQAAEMGQTLDGLAESMGVGGMKLRAYQTNLKGLIGGFAGVTKNIAGSLKPLLAAQTYIQTNLQLSAEQANKFTQYAAGVGESADTQLVKYSAIADVITNSYDIQVSSRDLIEDVTSMTADLQIQYGKIPEKLALANLKAKALGLSMSDLNKTGQNLLNIESSIGDELEYQLLSGRRLVNEQSGESLTNAYRTATIQGNAIKQAETMNQILVQEGATLEKNMFARQQMAKLLGTDEATLSRTLQQQKLLATVGAGSFLNKSITDMTEGLATNPAFLAKSIEDREKLLKELNTTAETRTPDMQMADYLASIVTNGIKILPAVGQPGDARSIVEQQEAAGMAAVKKYGTAAGNEVKNPANRKVVGAAVTTVGAGFSGVEMATAFVTALSSPTYKSAWSINAATVKLNTNGVDGDDVAMGPGVGRTIFGPEGAINLNKKDSIIAGTNLFGSGGSGGGADTAMLAAAIVSAINKQTEALTNNSRMNGQYWT